MVKKKHSAWLVIGAIGVVFGDIGTSPLYALPALFGESTLTLSADYILGIISLIIWSITLVVTIKYVGLVMRANNKGEGGIMAILGLVRQTKIGQHKKLALTMLGFVGVSLFYGDSVITPAISVLSAVEGTKLVMPTLTPYIVPITVIILAGLFALQARGTGLIGKLFGPIMIVWFLVSAIGGLHTILTFPMVLTALWPTAALSFAIHYPVQCFIALGAVILAVTGAEALYADMGHFGRRPITWAWLGLVFPALALNYLGQGALMIQYPGAMASPYFLLFPAWAQLPVVILATLATLIASQAVISGAFSLTRQAIQLGFAPRLGIMHTSREEIGQVYLPVVNWLIMGLVILIVVMFGSSGSLASAYGMAVSGTLAVDTVLFLVVMHHIWRQPIVATVLVGTVFLGLELLFAASTSAKFIHGAWLPILIAAAAFITLSTWFKGHGIISRERQLMEGPLTDFVAKLRRHEVPRVPGYAIYLGHHVGNAPLALHATLEQLHELHKNVVIVTVLTADAPHVPELSRVIFDGLGHPDDGISHVTLQFGYKDIPNVPRALELARAKSHEVDFDPYEASYFISLSKPAIIKNHRMAKWRKLLYVVMDRNSAAPTDFFKLPLNRTVEMSSYVEL